MKSLKAKPKVTGAICGDGLCPYVPCKDYPNCNHLDNMDIYKKKNGTKNKKM